MSGRAIYFRPVQAGLIALAMLTACNTTDTATEPGAETAPKQETQNAAISSDRAVNTVTLSERYEDALALQAANKPAAAIVVFRTLAAEGHAPSAFDYARALDQGDGVPRDEEAAKKWYKKAADLGSPRAFYREGLTYANGAGVEQDPEKAVIAFTKAAELDHAEAQVRLGRAYIIGEGVERDVLWGSRWYDKASVQGNADAQFAYAVQLASGKNIPLNLPLAAALLQAAEQNGHDQAGQILPKIQGRLSPEQQAEAAALLADLYNAGPRGIEDRPTFRYVQKALYLLGIDVGDADGWIGEKTRIGIKQFQTQIDVTADGALTPGLLQQLRDALKSADFTSTASIN